MACIEYETERLVLRGWRQSDKALLADMNSDPIVMEYFPALETHEESDEMVDCFISGMKVNGFGFWAVDRKDKNEFIGFVGLNRFVSDLPFCPCVEVGWRLGKAHWAQGFATEAGRKSLEVGFTEFELAEIVSFTALQNIRSRRVMEKLGMKDTENVFKHPSVPVESGLQNHCLYKITKNDWFNTTV